MITSYHQMIRPYKLFIKEESNLDFILCAEFRFLAIGAFLYRCDITRV